MNLSSTAIDAGHMTNETSLIITIILALIVAGLVWNYMRNKNNNM